MPKAFFICGNKRSGTKLLVRLLNLHDNVYITPESDMIWILYLFYNKLELKRYPADGKEGFERTLLHVKTLLNDSMSPSESFFRLQEQLMRKIEKEPHKKDLLWIGDKKPVQYADPLLVDFILTNFEDARFIHLIRHPFAACETKVRAHTTEEGHKKVTPKQALESWARSEKNVMELKKKAKVLDVRYEDLTRDPVRTMKSIFGFLDLSADNKTYFKVMSMTDRKIKNFPLIERDRQTLDLMRMYGYKPRTVNLPPFAISLINDVYKVIKRIKMFSYVWIN